MKYSVIFKKTELDYLKLEFKTYYKARWIKVNKKVYETEK